MEGGEGGGAAERVTIYVSNPAFPSSWRRVPSRPKKFSPEGGMGACDETWTSAA